MDEKIIQSISENDFDELTFESTTPTVVLFSANRCNVCKALLPIIEEVAKEYKKKLKVFSVDVDKNDILVKRFKLKGIPTLIIFKEGQIREKITGFSPKAMLENKIEVVLNI